MYLPHTGILVYKSDFGGEDFIALTGFWLIKDTLSVSKKTLVEGSGTIQGNAKWHLSLLDLLFSGHNFYQ